MSAYLVLDFAIHDLRGFMEYADNVPAFLAKHGGRYIVKGVTPKVMEGGWSPERMVILEFPSGRHAEDFLADPEFQALKDVRLRTTDSKLVLVEGCD